jgi:hypothetical protein
MNVDISIAIDINIDAVFSSLVLFSGLPNVDVISAMGIRCFRSTRARAAEIA